ncbi:MAG: hypothetical protein QXU42_07360 [Thermoproteota archaeon]
MKEKDITCLSPVLRRSFLSGEIASSGGPLHVFPFSFAEVLRINGVDLKKYYSSYESARIRHILSSCLKHGFFPDVVLGSVEPFELFKEYLDLVIIYGYYRKVWN